MRNESEPREENKIVKYRRIGVVSAWEKVGYNGVWEAEETA